jgi:BR serine/threonine kinase
MSARGHFFDLIAPGRLELPIAFQYFREIVYALDYLHSQGFCHGNLKSEDLLLDSHGHIKLADFGVFPPMKSDNSAAHFAAPEILSETARDPKAADIWSCGIILYALLTGSLPFHGATSRGLIEKVTAGRYRMPSSLPPDGASLIATILIRDVGKRITMKELQEHPLFRLGLPPDYHLPKPVEVLMIAEPINPRGIAPIVLKVMQYTGYPSEEELIKELTATEPTRAKTLYGMFRERATAEAIAWADQNALEDESPFLLLSPTAAESDDFEDSDDWELAPGSCDSMESSDDNAAETRGKWGKICLAPIIEVRNVRYVDMPLSAEQLMTGLQKFFTQEAFEWFHPNDIEFMAKNEDRHLFVRFVGGYQDGSQMMAWNMICVAGNPWVFAKFRPQLRDFLEGLVGTPICELIEEEATAGESRVTDTASAPDKGA